MSHYDWDQLWSEAGVWLYGCVIVDWDGIVIPWLTSFVEPGSLLSLNKISLQRAKADPASRESLQFCLLPDLTRASGKKTRDGA